MEKKSVCYILYKRTWLDFDIEKLTPAVVSLDRNFINDERMKRNATLSHKEVKDEVEYVIDVVEFHA
jgi:hypothetical protein